MNFPQTDFENRCALRRFLLAALAILMLLAFAPAAKAAPVAGFNHSADWKTVEYYEYNSAGTLVKVTGLKKIYGYYYYFKKNGNMVRSAWQNLSDGRRVYFQDSGRMAVNMWVRNKKGVKRWYVGADGTKLTSTITPDGVIVDSRGVYLQKSKTGWVKYSGHYYFVDYTTHKLLTNQWLQRSNGKYYYLGADGARLTGLQTIDGATYYLNQNGVRQSGEVTIGDKIYTFGADGKQVSVRSASQPETEKPAETEPQSESETEHEAPVDPNVGTKATTGKASVLVICGHGQGDPGASSKWGKESDLTREIGPMIAQTLADQKVVNVDLYNKDYDCYTQVLNTLNSVKVGDKSLQAMITGTGAYLTKTVNALKKNSKLPDFRHYDYVLEVHFNAKTVKDEDGDGQITGTGMMMNIRKKNRQIDSAIVKGISSTGMPVWGRATGFFPSSGLLNARVMQEIGVNYSLLETCFIDDGDDMKFYNAHKSEIASAVATAISNYFR